MSSRLDWVLKGAQRLYGLSGFGGFIACRVLRSLVSELSDY